MDTHAVRSMDWLFKKERIYLLARFWHQRATLAEKEVTALKEQLGGANQSSVPADMAHSEQIQPTSLEIELSAKDKEISQLLEDVQRLQSNMGKLQENSAKQIARLEEELENKRQHILRLEARLEAQKDYNDLKRLLSSLKTNPETKPEESDKKEVLKSESPASTTSIVQGEVGTLHNVETFGSLLGEEIVANWRRSLERTIVSQNSRPTPPPYSCWNEEQGKVKSETVEREGRSVSPGAEDMVNGDESPGEPTDSETNNNNSSTTSNNNLPNGLCPSGTFGVVGINNNLLGSGASLAEAIKSPFRFDERSPFRYGDDPGCMVGRFGESLIPKGDPMEARLQEMLRYNMDKYANQNLDTLHIARRVRELLSIHNVGQRLFAKYVLGLSQGTVSELLSKPKPWDKLTEKGRDSYRKMHAWACDENAVLLLKSLIPKKGKDPGIGNLMGGRPESDMTEERIVHILNEASNYIKPQSKGESPSNEDSQSPNHPQSSESPSARDSHNRRIKKYENDDISQEQVVRIYHEELVKLMGRRLEDQPFHGLMFPHFLGAGASTGEDVRLAMDAYHRELAKLNSQGSLPFPLAAMQQQVLSSHNGIAQDLSLPKQEKKDKGVNGDDKKEDERHGSAFSLVRPKVEPSSPLGNVILPPEDIGSTAGASTTAVSPLQRMASITNSLISQPPTQHHHTPSQRPLKAVLPPITQQQFDQFNNLNTEEIVRKVKEQLSQFSISQRLFGESVLGLSQGSVSDLLARPKPWHMLTQKGREPFIRMKMFLEDSNAVHKLVASQYKIAPEKLMRTGGYGVNSSPHSKPVSTNCGKYSTGIMHSAQNIHVPHTTPAPPPVPPLTPPDLKKCTIPPQHNQQISVQQFSPMKNIQHSTAPSVYEMAALTQELDTQGITTKIKEALLANNIGQKIFGEAVLGLSQGSVSELLSKPKPWHMLSIKGREPFIRMQLWLSDSQNIDRLQAIKTAKRELNKRRRGSGQQDNSSDTSSNDTSEFYQSSANSPPSSKKQRVLFSEEQKEALKIAFALDPYPNVATIEFLANDLNLVSRAISNWFHNHRMRLKQIPHGESPNREGQGCGFDPVKFRMLLSQRLGIQTPFSSSQYFPPYSTDSGNLSNLSSLSQEQREEGLDLTVKHDDDFEDNESHLDSEDSYSGIPETRPPESRSSRRKPAAPQWVNPDWQQESEVIINGVCVMQTDDFDREGREETVRVEPTPVPEEHCGSPEHSSELSLEESKVSVKKESKEDKWENTF